MNDLNPVYLPMTVSARWAEAIIKNDMFAWRACAYIAAIEADIEDEHAPDSVLVEALRAIANTAHDRYMAILSGADLSGADLIGASLRDADLSRANDSETC